MIFRNPTGHAIVNHHALLIGEHGVTGFANGLFKKGKGVNAIHKFGGIGPAQFNTAKRAHINEPHFIAHVHRFCVHAFIAIFCLTIKSRALPVACGHHFGAELKMALMHGAVTHRIKRTTGHVREFFRRKGRPRRGHTRFRHAAACCIGHQSRRWQSRMAPL